MLSKSNAPLYIKVVIPFRFPQVAPAISVENKVTHAKLDPQTNAYKSDILTNWGIHSTLLTVVR
jgi:hypothetical protein